MLTTLAYFLTLLTIILRSTINIIIIMVIDNINIIIYACNLKFLASNFPFGN